MVPARAGRRPVRGPGPPQAALPSADGHGADSAPRTRTASSRAGRAAEGAGRARRSCCLARASLPCALAPPDADLQFHTVLLYVALASHHVFLHCGNPMQSTVAPGIGRSAADATQVQLSFESFCPQAFLAIEFMIDMPCSAEHETDHETDDNTRENCSHDHHITVLLVPRAGGSRTFPPHHART